MTSEAKKKIVIENYFKSECDVNTSIKDAFIKGFELGLRKAPKEPRWIPISERLPEEREWIGTKRFGTTISDEVYVTLETSDGERFTKHLRFQNGELSQIDQETMRMWFKEAVPIAWMPEPKPYEPQVEVEE